LLAMKPITPFDILKTPAPGNSALDSRAEQTENHALDNLVVELGQHTCLECVVMRLSLARRGLSRASSPLTPRPRLGSLHKKNSPCVLHLVCNELLHAPAVLLIQSLKSALPWPCSAGSVAAPVLCAEPCLCLPCALPRVSLQQSKLLPPPAPPPSSPPGQRSRHQLVLRLHPYRGLACLAGGAKAKRFPCSTRTEKPHEGKTNRPTK